MASKTNTKTTDVPAETPEVAEEPKVKASKWTVLDAERAAWIASHARPAVSSCLCGCGESTKGRFYPGHDATLKETLKVTMAAGGEAGASAEAALATFGW